MYMMTSSNSVKAFFTGSGTLTRLILVNVIVFVLVVILDILGSFSRSNITDFFIRFTALPTNGITLLTRPWTFVTYMFLHHGFMHLLFNMLWLYFAGTLFREFLGSRRLLGVYLWGGLAGGFLYVLIYNLAPAFSDVVSISNARGASASVMAVVVAVAAYRPQFPVQLFFILRIRLWVIAVIAVLLDLLALRGLESNPGGHLAHLGGALFGYMYVRALANGNDWSEGIMTVVDKLEDYFTGRKRPTLKTVHKQKAATGKNSSAFSTHTTRGRRSKQADQQRMDEILDKISRSGYNSLSKEEKEFLFKISNDKNN
jgi:membrane associated rhomboid family serine protease